MINNSEKNQLRIAFKNDINYDYHLVEKVLESLGYCVVRSPLAQAKLSTGANLKDGAVFGSAEQP